MMASNLLELIEPKSRHLVTESHDALDTSESDKRSDGRPVGSPWVLLCSSGSRCAWVSLILEMAKAYETGMAQSRMAQQSKTRLVSDSPARTTQLKVGQLSSWKYSQETNSSCGRLILIAPTSLILTNSEPHCRHHVYHSYISAQFYKGLNKPFVNAAPAKTGLCLFSLQAIWPGLVSREAIGKWPPSNGKPVDESTHIYSTDIQVAVSH